MEHASGWQKIRILPDFDMKNQDTWTRARECNEETSSGSGELRQVGSGRHETHWTG